MGRIAEKNSRMRQGLKVDGSHYQPEHETYAYLRVQNISTTYIDFSKGMKVAQIIIEQLSGEPAVTYDKQAFVNDDLSTSYIVVMNLTMALCIVIMMGVILIFVNKAKNKKFLATYIMVLAALAVATVVMAFCL